MIRLEGVWRTYQDGAREVPGLSGVDVAIAPGEQVALMGKSGSGKSTLLHLMGALDAPTQGRVWVAGQDLTELDDSAQTRFRLERVGFVFQFFHLLPTLTVMENLLLPAELAGRPLAAARSRARELLAAVGLDPDRDTYPDRLSGGEQQRVAIARALLLAPPLLLADEPTGNLDSDTGSRVLELIFRLARGQGTTLVMATHSAELARAASRVITLRDGHILTDSGAPTPSSPVGRPASVGHQEAP